MFFRCLTGCILVLAASALPSLAQTRTAPRNNFSIAGNVRDDSDQQTMENVRVDLKLATGVPINTTFTRGNGEFEFAALGNGEYVVEVDLKGYDLARQLVTINNGSQRGVSLFMTRPMSVERSNSRTPISAHELSVPSKAHDEYEKGLQLFYLKSDFRGAIVQFQRAIKDFPTFYEAYGQMGNAYLQLKEMAPAEEAMRKSVDLSSARYSEAIFMLSGLLNDTSRYTDAATLARQGIDVDAASWRGPFELARALLGLKQLEEAEKSAIESRDLMPDDPAVYLMLANIHIQAHDYPALSKDLDGYLKLVPSGPQADQARKTRDDLLAAKQEAETQAQASAQQKPNPDAKVSPRENATSAEPPKESAPPAEPDSSGLPSLTPPLPEIQ
jgi:tetratricopeptide (TPR) repeat protein